jgi:hypothetical protein
LFGPQVCCLGAGHIVLKRWSVPNLKSLGNPYVDPELTLKVERIENLTGLRILKGFKKHVANR